MKKGLSVLLIAAALFGFYGGAVNINDVLACKDYWEEAGEKSTADMNKLEDGLNQLKDNEQAYLDGLKQVADGEVALAEGEAALEEGRATLAQGEADYAAAPGKLADARKQIAKGEKDLAAGEKTLAAGYKAYEQGKADFAAAPAKLAAGRNAIAAGESELATGREAVGGIDQLISGLSTAKSGYLEQWQPGFEKKLSKEQLDAYMAGQSKDGPGLRQARDVVAGTLQKKAEDIGLIETISGTKDLTKDILDAYDEGKGTYAKFDKAVTNADPLFDAMDTAKATLEGFSALAKEKAEDPKLAMLEAGLTGDTPVPVAEGQTVPVSKLNVTQLNNVVESLGAKKAQTEETKAGLEAKKAQLEQLDPATPIDESGKTAGEDLAEVKAGITQCEEGIKTIDASVTNLNALINGRAQVAAEIGAFYNGAKDKLGLVGKLNADLAKTLNEVIPKLIANDPEMANEDYAAAIATLKEALGTLSTALDGKVKDITTNKAALEGSFTSWDSGYKQLVAGQKKIADTEGRALPFAFKTMLTNPTIRTVLNDKAPALIPALTLYSTDKLVKEDLEDFDSDMNTLTASGSVIDKAIAVLRGIKAEAVKKIAQGEKDLAAGRQELANGEADYAAAPAKLAAAKKQLAQGEKDLAAGRAKLADGKQQYAQGLADYEAAPAKLADGRAQLEEGLKALMEGRATLEDGKAKLAEYEDGEQQVRDGLATLMSTKPDGGLKSILDRRNGDDDFDNGDNHLELDEGLEAVTVGRGYQADSGVLITKEITGRAIGTAAGLGAGALAVLAAILSFLKKNKGAGISALLSAAAGGAGVAVGTGAGMEFSSIAGSLVGATPWIAFGVLGGVALVHAIAHLASGKSA